MGRPLTTLFKQNELHFDPSANIPTDPSTKTQAGRLLVESLSKTLEVVRTAANDLSRAGSDLQEKDNRLGDVVRYTNMAEDSARAMEGPLKECRSLEEDIGKSIGIKSGGMAEVLPLTICFYHQRHVISPDSHGSRLAAFL